MSFEPRDYLRHILAEADYLISTSAGLTLEEFLADETLRRAFVRSLEVIGEASNQGPRPVPNRASPARVAPHDGYAQPADPRVLGVDYELVWDVVQNQIPEVQTKVRSILEAEE